MAAVAPGVRLSDFAVLFTAVFAFAIVFNCLTSSLVHERRTFGVLAILFLGALARDEASTRIEEPRNSKVKGASLKERLRAQQLFHPSVSNASQFEL